MLKKKLAKELKDRRRVEGVNDGEKEDMCNTFNNEGKLKIKVVQSKEK